jgi:uncharacterized protein (DUF2141 family)
MTFCAIAAACLLVLFSAGARAAELTVTVDKLRSNQGQVLLCIFSAESSDKAAFPDCAKGRPVRTANAPAAGGKVVLNFKGLKDGTYAVAAIHDENGNGQLDTNFLGIPVEGIAVSNNPRLLGKPSFMEGQFELKGVAAISIEAKYIL